MASITKSSSWQALERHFKEIKPIHMRDLFDQDKDRFNKNHIQYDDILVDFSKNRITDKTINLLINLAKEAKLENWIKKLFDGEKINFTEDRSALHTALRNRSNTPTFSNGKDVMPDVNKILKKMKLFSESVRNGEWKGYTGQPVKNIVNIGIGGSDLGPAMVCKALKSFGSDKITPFFVSNVDGTDLAQALEQCDPKTTLFIVASKTFTTHETMTNAFSARQWLINGLQDKKQSTPASAKYLIKEAVKYHFVALSTNINAVKDFGIAPENMFEFWDWVGGRYSLWSAIGLSIAVYIGMDNFEDLLTGAHDIDQHFRTAPLKQNIPILLALLGVWNINFFKFNTQAILPYDEGLSLLPSYLQQADMESNGKFIGRDGKDVCLHTGPILWGASGTNGQHAFYQLIHQGTDIIPCDFIMPIHSQYKVGLNGNDHHKILISNFIAQTRSLMMGKTHEEVRAELVRSKEDISHMEELIPHRSFEGNRPSNSIIFNELNPKTLGRLIAIYEHKIFTQGIIWNINSYDQWGVEYGKQNAKIIFPKLLDNQKTNEFDSSTNSLINYTKKII